MSTPTPAEAAAQLARGRDLVATDHDLRVHAAATLVGGFAVGVAVASASALYDQPRSWLWVLLAAAFALALGVEVWQRRGTRVVTRPARRYQRNAMGVTGGATVLVARFVHPPYVVLVGVAALPCLVAAWFILTRGRG